MPKVPEHLTAIAEPNATPLDAHAVLASLPRDSVLRRSTRTAGILLGLVTGIALSELLFGGFEWMGAWIDVPDGSDLQFATRVIGLCAIGSPFAVALRGGASLSMLGIGVQGKGGTRTGRFRCLARCLLTWLPGVVFGITRAFGGDSEAYGGVFALAIYSAAIGWAIPKPDRGPADLLAGTRHVAR